MINTDTMLLFYPGNINNSYLLAIEDKVSFERRDTITRMLLKNRPYKNKMGGLHNVYVRACYISMKNKISL